MLKIVLTTLVAITILYAMALLFLYRFQERLIFVPTLLSQEHRFVFNRPFKEVFIDVEGAQLNALVFEHSKAEGVVLYFHGNAGALDTWGDVAEDFSDFPYHVIIFDYRGFGKSTGRVESEAQMHADALSVYDFAKSYFNLDSFVFVGRSLGSGVAAHLATVHPPEVLILETPYYSLVDLAKTLYPLVPSKLLRYRLDTAAWIRQLAMPIHLIHGDSDPLIPFESSQRLSAENPNVRLHAIPGAVHNNITDFGAYNKALSSILARD
ncbi:MAG: alpha/beta hydrolase [Bradymonadia bacterium]